MRGRFVHSPPDGEPRTVDVPNAYADLSLERRTVLLRLRGIADPSPERVVGEPRRHRGRPHRATPGPGELEGAIPVTLAARLRRSHLLFLGYDLADWNLRLVVNRLRGASRSPVRVVGGTCAPDRARARVLAPPRRHARSRSDENAFARLLDGRLDEMASV